MVNSLRVLLAARVLAFTADARLSMAVSHTLAVLMAMSTWGGFGAAATDRRRQGSSSAAVHRGVDMVAGCVDLPAGALACARKIPWRGDFPGATGRCCTPGSTSCRPSAPPIAMHNNTTTPGSSISSPPSSPPVQWPSPHRQAAGDTPVLSPSKPARQSCCPRCARPAACWPASPPRCCACFPRK